MTRLPQYEPLAVVCPWCGAGKGERCHDEKGHVATHMWRSEQAARMAQLLLEVGGLR